MTTSSATIDTPLGPLLATADERGALTALAFADGRAGAAAGARSPAGPADAGAALATLRDELDAYFAGELRAFSVPLALGGTPWQRRVWDAVAAIPFGETRTYGQLAAALCTPAAARAVGHANGRNPACLVVPCHRVVGSRGALTGYAYGLERKRALLDHERGLAPAGG